MSGLLLARWAAMLAGWAAVVVFIWWGVPYVTAVTGDAIVEGAPLALPGPAGGAAGASVGQRAAAVLTVAFLLMGSLAAAALSWTVLLPAFGVRGPATLVATLIAALYVATTPYSASLLAGAPAGDARETTHVMLSFALSWLFAVALGGVLLRLSRPSEIEGASFVEFRLRTLEDSEDETYVRTLVAICASALKADRCSVFFVHAAQRELRSRSGTGLKADIRVPMDAGFVGHVLRTRRSLNVPDAYEDPRFDRGADQRTGYRTRSVLTVPLGDSDRVFGVLQALNRRDGPFSATDRRLLEHIARITRPRLEDMHAREVGALPAARAAPTATAR